MTGQPRRGRGRPALFHAGARAAYLTARAAGANQQEAAAAAGVAAKTVRNTRAADAEFRAADDAARATGRGKRLPHGESRYNHAECRCPICTKDASAARAARPDRDRKATSTRGGDTHVADVVPMPRSDEGSPESFPLARAS